MPALLVGFLAGVLLATLRAPLGVELFQLPALSASTAHAYRAAALVALAFGLLFAGPRLTARPAPGRLLLGAALGFFYRGLAWEADPTALALVVGGAVLLFLLASLIDPRRLLTLAVPRGLVVGVALFALLRWSDSHRPGAQVAFAIVTAVAMAVAARWRFLSPPPAPSSPARDGAETQGPREVRPPAGELSGLALTGAGVALALEGLARHLRWLGGGLREDDALFGALLLVLAAIGAGAFSQLFRSAGSRALGRGLTLSAAALACFGGLRAVGTMASPSGLERYLNDVTARLEGWRELGLPIPGVKLELYLHGTLIYDLAIALPALALPGILLGAGLRACREPLRLAAVAFGAAAGIVMVPALMGFELGTDPTGAVGVLEEQSSAALVPIGAKLAALGGLLAIALGGRLREGSGKLAAAGCLAVGAAAFLLPAPPTPIHAPWVERPAIPTLALDTPEGLVTIEATGGGVDTAYLDRRPLSPRLEDADLDRVQLELSLALLPPPMRARGEVRVLLLGQLTPGRALALGELGAARIDRTGSWHAVMPLLEARLFGPFPLPPGEVLALAEARGRLAAGDYDLLLAPHVPGDPPATENLGWPLGAGGAPPAGTLFVVWLDTRSAIASCPLGSEVLPATAELSDLALAIVRGGELSDLAELGRGAPGFYGAGAALPAPDGLDVLRTLSDERPRRNRRDLARRLAGGNPQGPAGHLTQGLARYFAAQHASSPFESRAARTELPEEALDLFRSAALEAEAPDAFCVEVLEAAGSILRGKRWIELIEAYLGPVAERHHPWPALEELLAYADLEFLDPETAVARLSRVLEEVSGTAGQWVLFGEAQAQTGATEEALASFWRALELAPADRWIRRRLAIQLVLAADPDGQAMVQDLLLEEPDDEELAAYLGIGPYPAPTPSYAPGGGRHEGH